MEPLSFELPCILEKVPKDLKINNSTFEQFCSHRTEEYWKKNKFNLFIDNPITILILSVPNNRWAKWIESDFQYEVLNFHIVLSMRGKNCFICAKYDTGKYYHTFLKSHFFRQFLSMLFLYYAIALFYCCNWEISTKLMKIINLNVLRILFFCIYFYLKWMLTTFFGSTNIFQYSHSSSCCQ